MRVSNPPSPYFLFLSSQQRTNDKPHEHIWRLFAVYESFVGERTGLCVVWCSFIWGRSWGRERMVEIDESMNMGCDNRMELTAIQSFKFPHSSWNFEPNINFLGHIRFKSCILLRISFAATERAPHRNTSQASPAFRPVFCIYRRGGRRYIYLRLTSPS